MCSRLPDRIHVGRIRRPHGLRGEVVVEVLSDVDDRFGAGRRLLVSRDDGVEETTVSQSRPHKGSILVLFEGYEDRDAAEVLRGRDLFVEREEVPEAPDGVFYFFELMDCLCSDETAGELGRVVRVVEDGGGFLLEVSDGERTVLLPFVKTFVRRIDVEAGEIELDLPPGLVETCASTS